MKLNLTTNELDFVSLIHFPGGMSKFTIRYDAISATYFSFVNPVTSTDNPSQRNILSLSSSKIFIDWTIVSDRLLYDDTGLSFNDSFRCTGFHYVHWQFDHLSMSTNQSSGILWNCNGSENMIYLIQTFYRGANSYYNSNRIIFKTLINYRRLINKEQQVFDNAIE